MAVQRLGDVEVGTLVKCNINGQPTQLRVLHQGLPSSLYDSSCDGTWVCLENIYTKRAWNSQDQKNYKNTSVNTYLNGTFLSLIESSIQSVIKQVKIPYCTGPSVLSGANGLECKVFLLSCYELGWTNSISSVVPQDGEKLDYFISGTSASANQKRIAKYNEAATIWWTRSPYMDMSPNVWDVNTDGSSHGWLYSNADGIRPAFILPQDLYVLSDGTLTTNAPPTAPGSITADNVIGNQQATITLTAATDPDGSVASYTYERQVDGGGWTVFATSSALTRTDPVDDSWTTVAYRAKATDNLGVSGPYATSETYTVVHNLPPTAPGSITADNVIGNQQATITLTAATDPDGSVASYIFERQVDGGAWQQVAQVNSLTQTDPIGEDWGTVAYRACAVDDLGLAGPYITGETYTVNSGWVTIGGPAEDMGRQPRRFDFAFSVSVSGVASVDAITVSVARDGTRIYSGTPSAGAKISVPVDARLLGAGEHTIEVQASKDDYLPASKRYTFTVPAVTIPAGGTGEQAQGSDGRPVFHTTLAQRCIGRGGVDIQAQVDALTARVKTLEG